MLHCKFLLTFYDTIADYLQCGLGLYVSGKALHDDPGSASFSCANNA
jgi:hypothetical protein